MAQQIEKRNIESYQKLNEDLLLEKCRWTRRKFFVSDWPNLYLAVKGLKTSSEVETDAGSPCSIHFRAFPIWGLYYGWKEAIISSLSEASSLLLKESIFNLNECQFSSG